MNLVRPSRGWSAGNTLVQIDGNNFRMPKKLGPAPSGITPPPLPSVRVLFDGIPALAVEVISSAIIRCVTPRHPPTRKIDGVTISNGLVSVTVQNIDDAGTIIAGESAVVAGAYTFERPVLGPREVHGTWKRSLDALLEHWRNVLMENVALNPSADYDGETGDMAGFIQMSELPGIAITRISFPDSQTEPDGSPLEMEAATALGTNTVVKRPPLASDIFFSLVLVSNSMGELANLAECVRTVFRDASIIRVPVDPTDLTLGYAELTMVQLAPLGISERLGTTDLVTAEAQGALMRVISTDLPGAPEAGLPGMPAWSRYHQGTQAVVPQVEQITTSAVRR